MSLDERLKEALVEIEEELRSGTLFTGDHRTKEYLKWRAERIANNTGYVTNLEWLRETQAAWYTCWDHFESRCCTECMHWKAEECPIPEAAANIASFACNHWREL